MSAISGFWCKTGRLDPAQICQRIVAAQLGYGPLDPRVARLGSIALGRSIHPAGITPDERSQPLSHRGRRLLIVADVRIDNRAELEEALGHSASNRASDSELLLDAYGKWGVDLLDHISGDFAFGLWDADRNTLLLARDPTGQRPLHYHDGAGMLAFATMPRALFAHPDIPAELDERRLAELVADLRLPANATYYRDILRVPSGHVLTASRDGVALRRYWQPSLRTLSLPSREHYVDAFRERLDHAVRARLNGAGARVACHLSAGFDSGAVTSTAAGLLADSGHRVLAFTSAPRAGFQGEMGRGRIADESSRAARTAALHPNIDHIIVRTEPVSPLALLDRSHEHAQYPVGQLSNNRWWRAINQQASQHGAQVLLTGQLGNHGLSAGNLTSLADYVRQGAWRRWWREARGLTRRGPARWRGVLANSFGPWLPKPVWVAINAAMVGSSTRVHRPYLLSAEWARQIDNKVNPGRDMVPPRDSYGLRRELLQSVDPGVFRKASLAEFAVDERDPTADRQLLEFCLSLPPDQLLKDGIARPLAKAALADRLPPALLTDSVRGYQMADWYEALDRAAMSDEVERVAAHPLARSIIDVGRLRQMVEQWPQGGWNTPRVVQEYRFSFLITLSVSHFIRTFDPARHRRVNDADVRCEVIET